MGESYRRDPGRHRGRGSSDEAAPAGRPAGCRGGDRGHGTDRVGPLGAEGVGSLGKDEGPDASGEGNATMVNGLGHLGAMARGGAQAV
jgi:hypothetical protein